MIEIIKEANCFIGGRFLVKDVAIYGGRIVGVWDSIEVSQGDIVTWAKGLYLMPGFVDPHVHLREPGFSHKGSIATETAAAAHGGYTTVLSMPNLSPAPDCVKHLAEQIEIIERDAVVRVVPYASITRGQKGCGELVDFKSVAPAVAGFSDDGVGVQDDALMEAAMWQALAVNKPIVAHCEVNELLNGGYIHQGEYCREHNHKGICSESEWRQVQRDLELVEKVGCKYHVCHISTKESVELLRQARAKGLDVSGETAPHYLLLTDEDIKEDGRFKMNPPLRSREDQLELINGILDGTIECIATDHAPHTEEEKSRGLEKSAFGIVGIEHAFALMYTYLVRRGVISLGRLVELMSFNARCIFSLNGGYISNGEVADLVLFDIEHEGTVDPATFRSKGKSTPFEGWKIYGKVVTTWVGGKVVYND